MHTTEQVFDTLVLGLGKEIANRVLTAVAGHDLRDAVDIKADAVYVNMQKILAIHDMSPKLLTLGEYASKKEYGTINKWKILGSFRKGWLQAKYEKEFDAYIEQYAKLRDLERDILYVCQEHLITTISNVMSNPAGIKKLMASMPKSVQFFIPTNTVS